jgi:hypothetical protein
MHCLLLRWVLSCLCSQNELISAEQFAKGFSRVYENMSDLSLDTPNALALTDAFKARAVADKVLLE